LIALPSSAREPALPPTIRIVVPFPAGGALDNTVRLLAEGMAMHLNRSVIVDNKPGASGIIGSTDVARSRPDGSTLLYNTGAHTTTPALHASLPYNTKTDFTPITLVSDSGGLMLLVAASSKYDNLKSLIAAAKEQPEVLSYGSTGVGTTTHLVAALFTKGSQTQFIHVPYRGMNAILPDLKGGRITFTILGAALAKQLIDTGQVRALAISGKQRHRDQHTVPTFAEQGVDGVDVPAWAGLFGPGHLSNETVDTIYQAVLEAARRPAFADEMSRNGGINPLPKPGDFKKYVDSELRRYQILLPSLGIKMD